MPMRRIAPALIACAIVMIGLSGSAQGEPTTKSPITHVVILYQENHSFNDLLGRLCLDEHDRCVASDTGQISNGQTLPLSSEGDVPPPAGHEPADQIAAINGGKMNGWDNVYRCATKDGHYRCLTQAPPGRVPTLWTLADTFAMSDATFQTSTSASWGSHLELVAATMDDFVGVQPDSAIGSGNGSGCDSDQDTAWQGPGYPKPIAVPSCVPDLLGRGPYRTSPVQYVPTIMDSMDAAGLPWRIYAPGPGGRGGYGWAICPTFYECLGSDQSKQVVRPGAFAKDASSGQLPALSIVIPYPAASQHNGHSLMEGDNWIAKNVEAVMQGPDWNSTAIFITYDDCGCYYDPVPPPPGNGIRVPMVIVPPYARPTFVDPTTATLASILAFVEQTFRLPPSPVAPKARRTTTRTRSISIRPHCRPSPCRHIPFPSRRCDTSRPIRRIPTTRRSHRGPGRRQPTAWPDQDAMTSASTATQPFGPAMSGFTSRAAIRSPSAVASDDTATTARSTDPTSTGGAPAHAVQQRPDGQSVQQPRRAGSVHRRQRQAAIVQDLDEHPAGRDDDERAELDRRERSPTRARRPPAPWRRRSPAVPGRRTAPGRPGAARPDRTGRAGHRRHRTCGRPRAPPSSVARASRSGPQRRSPPPARRRPDARRPGRRSPPAGAGRRIRSRPRPSPGARPIARRPPDPGRAAPRQAGARGSRGARTGAGTPASPVVVPSSTGMPVRRTNAASLRSIALARFDSTATGFAVAANTSFATRV